MAFSMKLGPQKTETSAFKGFGMKLGGSASSSAAPGGRPGITKPLLANPASRGTAAAKAKAASGGASAMFREAMDEESECGTKKGGVPIWSKPTVEAMQAQRQAEALVAADATVFQYDELIDDDKRNEGIEERLIGQQVRTDVLVQKKKVGLVLREGVEACRTGSKREPKYIKTVMMATDRRKVEQQMTEDRLLKKEVDAREGREVFVTEAFKDELKRRKKFEEELEAQDARDARLDAAKQEDGKGFADFHRRLLNGGLSSSRGAATTKEKEDVFKQEEKDELPVEEDVVKEEEKEDEDMAAKQETEEADSKPEQNGVKDVEATFADPGTKAAKLLAEQEERAEKAMSAKERFLARKRKAAEEAAAA